MKQEAETDEAGISQGKAGLRDEEADICGKDSENICDSGSGGVPDLIFGEFLYNQERRKLYYK